MDTAPAFEVSGTNDAALFTLKIFRGEGMCLLGMNWKNGTPTDDFVGFAIEYQEPRGTRFYPLSNRLSFPDSEGNLNPNKMSSRLSPIQKFRWVHFPYHTNLPGDYIYRVTPVFMNDNKELIYGDFQQAAIQLQSETYPDQLNVTFTRGFVSSQAFVDRFDNAAGTLLPKKADEGLGFVSSNPLAASAYEWMGFEARTAILKILDDAIADPDAEVRVAAYDLNQPEIVKRFESLGQRLKIIIDDSGTHGKPISAESEAAIRLVASAGNSNVQRQKVGGLQHNKSIAVKSRAFTGGIAGSTNLSWRGLFVQNNNAVILHGADAANIFFEAFDNLWNNKNKPAKFAATASAKWNDLKLAGIDAHISFSPHKDTDNILDNIATDIQGSTSSILYSLAFLYQTPGAIRNAIVAVVARPNVFAFGLSNNNVHGLDIQLPNGNPRVAFPANLLAGNLPEPFKAEVTGGGGIIMHHKFVVIDFDKPTARVYLGSYNFSVAADIKNGENLVLIKDRRVAVSYMIQAVTMFDHYEFRNKIATAEAGNKRLYLRLPPKDGEQPWWRSDFEDIRKIKDRELFS